MGQMDTPLANTLMQTGQASLCLILQHFPQLTNCFHSNEMLGGDEVKLIIMSESFRLINFTKELPSMILFCKIILLLITILTGKNTPFKWFRKIPGGIGILCNVTQLK